jgi:hypothetical protein
MAANLAGQMVAQTVLQKVASMAGMLVEKSAYRWVESSVALMEER